MFGSAVLDVVLGVGFFFLATSLLCSAVREGLEGILKMRALDLERGIRELLADPSGSVIAKALFAHPKLKALFLGDYDPQRLVSTKASVGLGSQKHMPLAARRNLPSYIPAANFAEALLDLVARGPVPLNPDPQPSGKVPDAASIRAGIALIQSAPLQRALLSAFDTARDDVDKARANIEAWFDSSMDRVSGWYKRRTQLFLFLIGLAVAAALNLDAIEITKRLGSDPAFREMVTAEAEATGKSGEIPAAVFEQQKQALENLGSPIGWSAPCKEKAEDQCPKAPNWQMPLGWLITAIATMLGAPFWFDLLNKIVALRAAGRPPEKEEDKEKSAR
jgi:hypothetical protein